MPKSKYYITAALPYASAVPHIGNTYEAILTDAITKYRRLRGDDAYFVTGTDEHGQKIENIAKAENTEPLAVAERYTSALRDIWQMCGVEEDDFIRTTEERHMRVVQGIFRRLRDKGDLYKSEYEGWYCVPDEAFYTDTQVGDDHVCPDCGRPVEKSKEEAYFFRLSAYTEPLRRHIEAHPEFIMPDSRRREMVNNFLTPGLTDLCVTRTSFSWGVPLDFDPAHVVYVWMDALTGYISALGYEPESGDHGEAFRKYWPPQAHIIGKDILRFHSLFWPAMLMALELPLPEQVFAHPWFMMNESKMSKSLGNVIYADELIKRYGRDAVRYYVLREMPYANDGNITRELFHARYNTDLANDLGNLSSRTVAMCHKYFQGKLPSVSSGKQANNELLALIPKTVESCTEKFDNLQYQAAIAEAMKLVSAANPYIDRQMPWSLAKEPGKTEELSICLHALCETLRTVSVLLYPVMPDAMGRLRLCLGLEKLPLWEEGYLESYCLGENEILFPRKDAYETEV